MGNHGFRLFFGISILFLACPPLFAMGAKEPVKQAGEAAPPPPVVVPQGDAAIPIAKVLEKGGEYAEKTVVVEGVYRGWKGKCSRSFMLTRSDWILEDESGCIYITGLMPPGLSPARPRGEHILVRGTVRLNSKGKPVIKASRLTQIH